MKKVLVTGASSGIGKSMVGVFFEKGWQVLALARREDKLNKLREEYKGIQSLVCDLSDPSAIKSLKSKISSPIHALVNNAGIYHPCSVDEDEDQVWQDHYNTNHGTCPSYPIALASAQRKPWLHYQYFLHSCHQTHFRNISLFSFKVSHEQLDFESCTGGGPL